MYFIIASMARRFFNLPKKKFSITKRAIYVPKKFVLSNLLVCKLNLNGTPYRNPPVPPFEKGGNYSPPHSASPSAVSSGPNCSCRAAFKKGGWEGFLFAQLFGELIL